jgi:hypothetical protein
MKIMIQSTNVRLPKAPTVRPMIDISKFSVGHDFASLKTLNCKYGRCGLGIISKMTDIGEDLFIGSSIFPFSKRRDVNREQVGIDYPTL